MISHYVFHMVATRTAFDVDTAVATLTTLWARGIGLDLPWDAAPADDSGPGPKR